MPIHSRFHASVLLRRAHVTPGCVAAAVAAILGTAPAFAQESTSGLEEVVVTARYRQENLQTTPLAITALAVEDLQERNFQNVNDLGLSIPNAFIREPVSNFGPTQTIGLRGLTQVDFNYAFEPTVGVYIDDVYHGSLTGSSMDLTDLERVEVLRGPQGTLFGINTMGGAIRLISKKPTGDGSGWLEVTYGERQRIDVKGVGDFALIPDTLFMRVSAVSRRQDGYGERLDFACQMAANGTPALSGTLPKTLEPRRGSCALGDLGGMDSNGAKVALRYLANEKLEFNLTGDYSTQLGEPPVQAYLTRRGGTGPGDGDSGTRGYDTTVVIPKYGTSYTTDNRFLTGNPYTNYNSYGNIVAGTQYDPNTHLHSYGTSGTVDYSFTEKTHLKVITAYRSYDTTWDNDSDGTPFELIQTNYLQEHRQFQAETQLTSSWLDDKLNWTWGLFYYNSHSRAYNTANFVTFGLQFVADDRFSTENKSTFLNTSYKVTDKLSASVGLRYSDESKTNTFQHFGLVVLPGPLDFGSTHTSYKVDLDYQATDRVFLYGSVSDGFSSAGVTPRVFTPEQVQALPGDEVVNYEVGAKLEFLDRRLRLNSDIFYMDYKNRLFNTTATECNVSGSASPGTPYFLAGGPCPVGTPRAGTPGTPWFLYINQPGKIRGFESELTAFPVPALAINASVGYNKFKGNEDNPAAPDFRDDSALLQPTWNASAGVQYGFGFANGGKLTPRLDYYYQSYTTNGTPSLPQRHPDDIVPGYGLVNLRLSYDPPDNGWQIAGTVTNLFDKFYWQQLGTATQRNGLPAVGRVGTPSRPREWAVTFRKNFDTGK